MRPLMVLGLLFGLAAAPVSADPSDRPGNLEDCLEQAQGMTMEVDFCLSDEFDRQEPRLTAAYETALGVAEEGQRALLEQSQKDFLAYRDSWCGAKSAFQGSGRNEYRVRCMLRATRERIAALEGFDNP